MNFSEVKAGDRIKYIGDSWAFGGYYKTVTAESTYSNEDDCPDNLRGELMIVELMNNGTPMFFPLKMLDSKEWDLAHEDLIPDRQGRELIW